MWWPCTCQLFHRAAHCRWRNPIVLAGLALTAAALVGMSGQTVAHFWWALALLGVGWNFGFLGASAMVLNATRHGRPAIQSINDFVVFGTMVIGSLHRAACSRPTAGAPYYLDAAARGGGRRFAAVDGRVRQNLPRSESVESAQGGPARLKSLAWSGPARAVSAREPPMNQPPVVPASQRPIRSQYGI